MMLFPTTCCGELGSFDAGNLEQMTSSAEETVVFDNERENQKRSPVKTFVKFFSLSLNRCTHSRPQGVSCSWPFTTACHQFKWSYDAVVCAPKHFQVLFLRPSVGHSS